VGKNSERAGLKGGFSSSSRSPWLVLPLFSSSPLPAVRSYLYPSLIPGIESSHAYWMTKLHRTLPLRSPQPCWLVHSRSRYELS